MNNGSLTVEARLVWALQYITPFENWLKARLPGFCHCKFHEHSIACGRDADC